jgi:hypothetical protein
MPARLRKRVSTRLPFANPEVIPAGEAQILQTKIDNFVATPIGRCDCEEAWGLHNADSRGREWRQQRGKFAEMGWKTPSVADVEKK